MAKRLTSAFIIFVLAAQIMGCATIWNHRSRDVKIITEPENASVRLNESSSCVSPCVQELPYQRNHKLIVKKDGYKTLEHPFKMRIHWLVFMNFIGGPYGLIGFGIDYLTGKMFTVSKPEILLTLEKKTDGVGDDEAEDEDLDEDNKEVAPKKESTQDIKDTEQKQEEIPLLEQNPPAAVASDKILEMQSIFSESEIDYQIGLYYGQLSKRELQATRKRIYYFLIEIQKEGNEPNMDEAVRRDQFRNNVK